MKICSHAPANGLYRVNLETDLQFTPWKTSKLLYWNTAYKLQYFLDAFVTLYINLPGAQMFRQVKASNLILVTDLKQKSWLKMQNSNFSLQMNASHQFHGFLFIFILVFLFFVLCNLVKNNKSSWYIIFQSRMMYIKALSYWVCFI